MPPSYTLPAPPGQPSWDIAFTRLTQVVRPQIEDCALALAHRFQAIGLGMDTQVRQTPRGLSTFLAVLGRRGLICIVDLTLVDGMAVGQGPRATLDIRLLDACGDVVAEGLAGGVHGRTFDAMSAAQPVHPQCLAQAVTALYVATLGLFDLLPPVAQPA